MLRYEPPALLEFRWGNDETLRFELQADGDGSLLTFVNTFDELGKGARDAAGWHTTFSTTWRLPRRTETVPDAG